MSARRASSAYAQLRNAAPQTPPEAQGGNSRENTPVGLPAVPRAKWTIVLEGGDAAAWDFFPEDIRLRRGLRVTKAQIFRALVAVAQNDNAVMDQVVARLRDGVPS